MSGIEHLVRIRIEGDDDAGSPESLGQPLDSLDQTLMGDMDTIEHPDGDDCPCWRALERVKPPDDTHQ